MADTSAYAAPPQLLPQPSLPPPPWDVTSGLSQLRVACAKWAPEPGTSDHHAEISACNAVLDRDPALPAGITLGVIGALSAVAFWMVCRSTVRMQAFGKFDDIAAYAVLAFLSIPIGLAIGAGLLWQFGFDWTNGLQRLAVFGSMALAAGFLSLLRWRAQAGHRATT